MEFKTQTFTISDLYNWHKAGELFLQPKFQRRKVWRPIAQSYLIDTIVRGLPLPKIYYRMQVDPTAVRSVREVVDGQQRLDAIFTYIDGAFTVSRTHNSAIAGKRFSMLPEHLRSQLLSYDISADLLIGADDIQVLQIFARLNSNSITLNAQEHRNAKYFGHFKQLAYDLGTKHYSFWRANQILTDQNIARMADAELASELMVALLAGLQDKKSSLDKYYALYEDAFAGASTVKSHFELTLKWIAENALDAIRGTIFVRRTLFYSLFMATADLLVGIEKGVERDAPLPKTLSAEQRAALATELERVSTGVRANEPPKDLTEFAIATARQTDNLGPRKVRHNLLVRVLRKVSR